MRVASAPAPFNRVLVRASTADQTLQVVFRVKGHTKFEKIINAFCSKKSVDPHQVRFVFDGQRVNPQSSPEAEGMEDGDTIDAFLEQVVRPPSGPSCGARVRPVQACVRQGAGLFGAAASSRSHRPSLTSRCCSVQGGGRWLRV